MDQWITNLWQKNKIVFFLLIPIILLVVFKNVIFAFLARSVKNEVKDAVKKDDELKKEQESLVNESEKQKASADAIENQIKNNAESVSDDWHKKKN
jgi:cell division protein FtsL